MFPLDGNRMISESDLLSRYLGSATGPFCNSLLTTLDKMGCHSNDAQVH